MQSCQPYPPQLRRAEEMYRNGRVWLTVREAANLLRCDPGSLMSALRIRGTLGCLEYYWAGNFLKISTMSVIRFLSGGYPREPTSDPLSKTNEMSEKEEASK